MLAKCANPECGARFRYLNEGTVYLAEWPNEGDTCELSDSDGLVNHRVGRREMFWLCSTCNRQLTLIADGDRAIVALRDEVRENDDRLLRPMKIAV